MSAPKPANATDKTAGKVKPLKLADSPLAHGIARKLMGFFLMLVTVMLFAQISLNLYGQINRLHAEINFVGNAYVPIASTALWSFDDSQLDASAKVLLRHEEIVGVTFRYIDANKKPVLIRHGKTLELEQAAKLEADEQSQLEILDQTGWHRFPVYYEDERQPRLLIGEMTLFVNTYLILKRHAAATMVIAISCVIAVLFMWLIIRSVLNRQLAEPLRILIIKLLQIQHVLPEGEVSPDDVRKLRLERFGTELRLFEKQLEKIVLNMAMQSGARPDKAPPPTAPAQMDDADTGGEHDGGSQDSYDRP